MTPQQEQELRQALPAISKPSVATQLVPPLS